MAKGKHEVGFFGRMHELEPLELWAPFRDLGFGSRIQRMMEQALGANGADGLTRFAVDVTETEKGYVVSAELPGVAKDDVVVEAQDGVISIRGEKKSRREEKKEHGRLLECSFGSFARSFALPADADASKIDASFKDGVLRLEVGKKADAKPKTIAVK